MRVGELSCCRFEVVNETIYTASSGLSVFLWSGETRQTFPSCVRVVLLGMLSLDGEVPLTVEFRWTRCEISICTVVGVGRSLKLIAFAQPTDWNSSSQASTYLRMLVAFEYGTH